MSYAILPLSGLGIMFSSAAMANPACIVCTVAIGAALEISRLLGVPDTVVGVWTGALFIMLYYFSIKLAEAKKWTFRFYRVFWALVTLAFVPFVYKVVPYKFDTYFGVDAFLIAMIAGAGAFDASQRIYQRMKAANNGHAHFPFEKVAMAVAFLAAVSAVFYYLP
jgi:hypothetical protein